MDMQKQDRRIRKTQRLLKESLLELMEKKDIKKHFRKGYYGTG